MKTCYYELLEVSSTATETELKKAYRKKALQLHPDKNPDNVEEANHKFSLVRAAYEVLSDPQERTWYDNHKQSILNDEDEIIEGESYLPSISTEEIYRFFNPGMYTEMNDSISGFYQIVTRIFGRLAHEEIQHGKYSKVPGYDKYHDDDDKNINVIDPSLLMYPRFGNSQSSYVDQVRQFYNIWGSFQTCKTFNWKDEYRYSIAPDRRTRRMMERENKKLRDEARKEYNEAIKKFVNFIKKRDPRVKSGQEELNKLNKRKQLQEYENQIRQQQHLNKLKNNGANKFTEQDWQKLTPEELQEFEQMLQEEYEGEGEEEDDDSTDSEFEQYKNGNSNENNYEIHEFECIVCDKIFKNETQFQIHEDSKKHKKNVRQLQWEMKQEGIELGIDKHDDNDLSEFETASSEFHSDYSEEELEEVEEYKEDQEDQDVEVKPSKDNIVEESKSKIDLDNLEVDDEIDEDSVINTTTTATATSKKGSKASLNKVEEDLAKLLGQTSLTTNNNDESDDDDDDDDWLDNKKKSKKGKKTKKKSQTNSKESTPNNNTESKPVINPNTEKCSVCGTIFQSRNQLFNHVKSEGHAAPPPPPPPKSKSKSKKKNKRK